MKVKELLEGMDKYSRTHKRVWSISKQSAEFLNILVSGSKPKNILEIGTSIGFSCIWMGIAAKKYGGRITTIDIDPEKVETARENIRKARLSSTIKVVYGDAFEEIKKLDRSIKSNNKKWDFVFIDGKKIYYLQHIKDLLPKLNKGAIIVADNAISHEDSVKDYLKFVRNHKQLKSVLVPIGSGMELSIKV